MKSANKLISIFGILYLCSFFAFLLFLPKQANAAQQMWYCVIGSKTCTETSSEYTTEKSCADNVKEYIDGGAKYGATNIPTTQTCYLSEDDCKQQDATCKTEAKPVDNSNNQNNNTDTNTNTSKEDKSWSANFGTFKTGTAEANKSCPASGSYESGILKGIKCNEPILELDQVIVIVKNIVNGFLLPVIGTLFVIIIIVGGLQYITSAGDKSRMEAAKKTLTAGIIGFSIVLLSYTIVAIVASILGGSIG